MMMMIFIRNRNNII